MRITNSMTTNRLLMNVNRNSTTLDRLFMQLSSGKVIQSPSENPIVASRALRFRTNVSEVQQFQRNVTQAISWMEVSEQHLHNATNILTTQRSELMVQAASSTYTFQNRQTITRVIELMFDQMNTEMNGTFAGRYIFSGFRTDQPPVMTRNNLTTAVPPNTVDYSITMNLHRRDIRDAGALYWRDQTSTPPGELHKIASQEWLNRPDRDTTGWDDNVINVYMPDMVQDVDGNGDPLYDGNGDPVMVPVPGTGGTNINIMRLPYNRTDTRTHSTPVLTRADGTTIPVIERSINGGVNPFVPEPGSVIWIPETGELVIHSADLPDFEGPGVSVDFDINGVYQNELNPRIFFETMDNVSGIMFSQADQEIQFELGTNVHLTINTQARNAYPWQLFADMHSLLSWVNGVELSESPPASEEQLAQERAFFGEMLHTKFTDIMARMDIHMQTNTTEFTALGARMERMEMIDIRLDENEDTFRMLRDQNENIDYIEVIMRLNAAEAVMQAAMQVGARISQLSLVNFI